MFKKDYRGNPNLKPKLCFYNVCKTTNKNCLKKKKKGYINYHFNYLVYYIDLLTWYITFMWPEYRLMMD